MASYRFYDVKDKEGNPHRKLLSEEELVDLLDSGEFFYETTEVGSSPALISGISKKPDSGFRDVLKRIRKANIYSKIETY